MCLLAADREKPRSFAPPDIGLGADTPLCSSVEVISPDDGLPKTRAITLPPKVKMTLIEQQ